MSGGTYLDLDDEEEEFDEDDFNEDEEDFDEDDEYDDLDEIELINDLPTASGSNAYYIYTSSSGSGTTAAAGLSDDFVIGLFLCLGVIAGILLIGSRRFRG
jgi:hypothetical protein